MQVGIEGVHLRQDGFAVGGEDVHEHAGVAGGDAAGVAESAGGQFPDHGIVLAGVGNGMDKRRGQQEGQVADGSHEPVVALRFKDERTCAHGLRQFGGQRHRLRAGTRQRRQDPRRAFVEPWFGGGETGLFLACHRVRAQRLNAGRQAIQCCADLVLGAPHVEDNRPRPEDSPQFVDHADDGPHRRGQDHNVRAGDACMEIGGGLVNGVGEKGA